ncbi:hypothetical protein LL998_34075 (plasmid) [Burkholderia ambifaria]|uniref:HNH endonuclease n=1 Tax=Burkholderia ambifaria TaxID=152480 RepID=UPI001E587890|nr:HNH endonuclease [Burkholderia ambifaria]UEP39769.1 hypothetical protein LL998_34075 [Burkholderia ambifaria]
MSKTQARSPQSYENEELALALVPAVLTAHGFSAVAIRRRGQVKLIDALDQSGQSLCFWLKLGWTGEQRYSAVQFGLFGGEHDSDIPDARFLQFVDERVASVRTLGASHALFIHMAGGLIANWVVMAIDDVSVAYHHQMASWPQRARNTKSATLWFEDDRLVEGADCVQVVMDVEVSLQNLVSSSGDSAASDRADADDTSPASKKVTIEVERRMKQAAFRLRLGKHYGWQCAVSGAAIKAALEAAHLPGRNWRFDNRVTDGVLLRADLHRLLDAGVARIEGNRFVLDAAARLGEYARLHGTSLAIRSPVIERGAEGTADAT